MSEKPNRTQHQKQKTSRPAIASVLIGILGISILVVMAAYYRPWWCEFAGRNIVGLSGIIGFILAATSLWKTRISTGKSKGRLLGILGMVSAVLLLGMWWVETCGPASGALGMACNSNLSRLGKAMLIYSEDNQGRYPEPNQWCDLLSEHNQLEPKHFLCPAVRFRWRRQVLPWPVPKNERCYYAMNPHCYPNSTADTVLLFETKGGWNKLGGRELLTAENHWGYACNILFNDGRVRLARPKQLGQLRWGLENSRTPSNDEELGYWLRNMVWFHRFSNEEMRLATGLAKEEIAAALKKADVRPDNGPKWARHMPLWVLPYPGGRHPRTGFLEGAMDPQRETKFSVFAPWDANSYVVVDLPEAIWSNLGLTYLAHTHVDTIWSKQGIELPKLEWNRHSDGALDIKRELPNGIAFGVKVERTREAIRMEMWLKNGTEERLSDLRTQICAMPKMAAGFEQQTNENKVFTNPYVACRDTDGKRWIITAWEGCHNPWGNPKCPCFHSDPKFPDLEPGQTHRLRGWLSFYEGADIEAEFQRIEKTGWREQP
jgi:hypothetical protein